MQLVKITTDHYEELSELHKAYKLEIGECTPTNTELESLRKAIENEQILFYGCICDHTLIACCSICITYSTFHYGKSGVFEDFYIQPKYRHKGIAKKLAAYAYEQSGVGSLTVGCADCDIEMYRAIGFKIPLGNMLAFEE
ncbi:MAG: GNAT family N-acetyltransferase [Christensenellaceae bacterium]|nr:GNAT family N-acetyltransferase [Christensenellaceae bacterium]MBR3842784.1 GNAT family N-acetyltransferase [Christensenellaceae bacterium]